MNNKFIKSLSFILAGSISFLSIPVSAYDIDANNNSIESVEYQNNTDTNFNNKISVYAQIGSEYKVTIPKVIVLSGVSKKANYYVNVVGDISGKEIIKVVPENSVILSSENKNSETGYIVQDRMLWTCFDLSQKANGQVTANDLSAGKWSGIFYFNIELDEKEDEFVLGDIILPKTSEFGAKSNDVSFRVGESKLVKTVLNNTDTDSLLITSSNEDIVKVEDNKLKGVNAGTSTIDIQPNKNGLVKETSFDVTIVEKPNVHKHIAGTVEREDKIIATCTKAGSYDEVIYCTGCREELSRTEIDVEPLGHNYVNGICSRCNDSNDIQVWLSKANINDKDYTTITEVLNDRTTLLQLMSSKNAVDYLVDHKVWINDLCGNQQSMECIGKRNYASDTLLDDADWCMALATSQYMSSVFNVKVPLMTSDTSPSGVASASSYFDRTPYPAYGPFSYTGKHWYPKPTASNMAGQWLQYQFTKPVKIKAVYIYVAHSNGATGSNGSSWRLTGDGQTMDILNLDTWNPQMFVLPNNNNKYTTYRLTSISVTPATQYQFGLYSGTNFYGREDVVETN